MSIEELIDFMKTVLNDRKLIDTIAKFAVEDKPIASDENPGETTIYIEVANLELLKDVLEKLPLIVEKDNNLSSAMQVII